MQTITPQDLAATRRSIIRTFRAHQSDFNLDYIKEYWAMMFLHYQFPKSQTIRQRWLGSPVFMNWVSTQFDQRNCELLLQCNLGIHVSQKMDFPTFEEFKEQFDLAHARAITTVFPCTPIVHQIQATIC